MEIVIIFALILLNGIFAMSEMSLVSSKKYKLETANKKGMSGARTALELSENPTKFLSTVQIGITGIGVLLGIYSGDNLTQGIQSFFEQFPFIAAYAGSLSTALVVISITYFSIVLGELLPKRIGMVFPENIIMVVAKPMSILSFVTSPFVWLLATTNNVLLKILGIPHVNESAISEEEIKTILKESAEGGEIEHIEHNIVERVFELGDRRVDSLFTHKSDIVFFTLQDSWDDIKNKINAEKHSAYPVSKTSNLDDIIGIVLLKDLFIFGNEANFDIQSIMHKPIYFNESTYTYQVLEVFKKERIHYGIVVDEFGSIEGIITMDDVVDALVGDISENHQDEYQIIQRNENSWLVDGQYNLIDFERYFDITLPDEHHNEFTTVAGLIIHTTSRIPEVGDTTSIEGLDLEVVDKDGLRIDKILVTKKSPETPSLK